MIRPAYSFSILTLLFMSLYLYQSEQPLWPSFTQNDSIRLGHENIFAPSKMSCTLDSEDLELYAYYTELNVRYFDNKLPWKTCVHWQGGMDEKGYLGLTDHYNDWFDIAISDKLKAWPKASRFVVLHEAAHVSCYTNVDDFVDPHGGCWTTEMRRLAAGGAMDKLW